MKLKTSHLMALFVAIGAPAQSQTPPEPIPAPDFADVTRKGSNILLGELFDPSSAQFSWISGYSWGYLKPLLGRRDFGWIACGRLNAKNRMGGYVGAKPVFIFVNAAGTVTADYVRSWISTCDKAPNVTPQSELVSLGKAAPAESPSGRSVADELSKLAALRAEGILSDDEFQAEKAKLLAR